MTPPEIPVVSVMQAGLVLVGALVVGEALRLAVRYFFKKITREDYLIKRDCEKCTEGRNKASEQRYTELNEFKREVRTSLNMIKGILLVLATKGEIPLDKIDELINRNAV